MKDVSVEYAHIYTNSEIEKEHQVAINSLKSVKQELKGGNQSFNLVVLVDDYSFPDPTFDYESYSDWLESQGFKPDFLYRESQLIPVCDQVIEHIQEVKLKNSLISYIKNKKYPCSLFIAAWYLLRLGALQHSAFDEGITARTLINILPDSFKPFEDDAVKIIRSTKFKDLVDNISNQYLEGRILA